MTRIIRFLILMSLLGITLAVCLRAQDPPAPPPPPTIESLQKQVADLKAQVEQLKAQLADMDALRQMWRTEAMNKAADELEQRQLAAKHAADAKSAAPAR